MKKLLLVLLLLLTACSVNVTAQSTILWENFCPNTHNLVVTETELGSTVVCEEIEPTPTPNPNNIKIIDHTNVYLYNDLTTEQKQYAQSQKFMFTDRSVGVNIGSGLNCLASLTWESSVSACRNYWTDSTFTALKLYTNYNTAPEVIKFPGNDNRNNILFLYDGTNSWQTLLSNFSNQVTNYYNQGYRIFGVNFNYLMVQSGSNTSFSTVNMTLQTLENQYPDITIVYMTTSLARVIGTYESKKFNDDMRTYVLENNKYLLDIADIESHGENGIECTLNSYPIICKDYTVEINGGHLLSGGMIKISKAIWLLLSNIE